ncbi:MAG: type III pantothenate kinase [Bacteroidales bacterium]|nr:type III pantothenate kinase [Bacteroidales bacterium]
MSDCTYTLTIDRGNTSAKLAIWRSPESYGGTSQHVGMPECCRRICVRMLTAADIAGICRDYDICRAIWCSVADDADTPSEALQLLQQLCPAVTVLTVDTPTPLTVGYATPHTLGVDRLAAAVGAYSLAECHGRDILVSDIGTAITYDHVSPAGQYEGGNIAPGIFMRLCALHHYTARLPQTETDGPVPLWGYDTDTALRSGAINGVVAELEFYRSRLGEDSAVVLTGGAAALIADRLSFKPTVIPDLVGLGLYFILHFNQ